MNQFRISILSLMIAALTMLNLTTFAESEKIKALIVDGQNNHGNWPETTQIMKKWLEGSGRFSVDIARTAMKGTDETFAPDFDSYDVVISNYNGSEWPEKTKTAFINFVSNGGGFVSIHAADNAFPKWKEYNEMIGLGGWGGRNQASGPYVYFDDAKKEVEKMRTGSYKDRAWETTHPAFEMMTEEAKNKLASDPDWYAKAKG